MNLELLKSLFPDWEIITICSEREFQFNSIHHDKLLVVVDQLPSTRKWVKSWSAEVLSKFSECLVLAIEQSAGQGRMSRSWFADKNASLAFNYVCDAPAGVAPGLLSLLPAWSQIKVYGALYQLKHLDLKWPNDVLIGSKKCSGSLMEMLMSSNGQKLSLGLGINVGKMEFPMELKSVSTSLSEGVDTVPEREQVLSDIVSCFQAGMQRLDSPEWLLKDIQDFSSYVKGCWLEYELNGERQQGMSKGLTEQGGLWIENERGVVREFYGSEIHKIRKTE